MLPLQAPRSLHSRHNTSLKGTVGSDNHNVHSAWARIGSKDGKQGAASTTDLAWDGSVLLPHTTGSPTEGCLVQHLTDLDDDCLLNVFSFLAPLPDLISLSKACRVSATVALPAHLSPLSYVLLSNSQCHG